MPEAITTPDASAKGLVAATVDPARYDGAFYDPKEVTGLMHAMMPAGVRVLDVGCGTGSVTQIANRGRGNEVIGVEPDSDRAAIARSRGITVHNALLDADLQARLGLFDVVMTSDVLEHIAAPEDYLSMLRRSLKPGGLLLLSVPNVAHWSIRWKLLFGRFDYQPTGLMDATHLRWFTARSLRSLLEASGFEVVQMRQSAGPFLPEKLRPMLNHLPERVFRQGLALGTRIVPGLFGFQHVVKAKRTD